jgi:hypothetical protein
MVSDALPLGAWSMFDLEHIQVHTLLSKPQSSLQHVHMDYAANSRKDFL